jgi:hypothetical protein
MGTTQIVRTGLSPVNVTDLGDAFAIINEGVDLFMVFTLNGQIHTVLDIYSDINIPSLPESELEKDNITIDLSIASFTISEINEIFFMIDSLVSGDYEGRQINLGNNDYPDSDSGSYNGEEAMNSLLMKNFTILK